MAVLTSDPVTRTTTRMHFSESDESAVIESVQDIGDLQGANKALYNSFRGRWEKHAEYGDFYARIPAIIWGQLVAQGIALDDDRLAAWLDDNANQDWRTRPGRIGKRKITRRAVA